MSVIRVATIGRNVSSCFDQVCEAVGLEIRQFDRENELLRSIAEFRSDIVVMRLGERPETALCLHSHFRSTCQPVSVVYIDAIAPMRFVVEAMKLGATEVLPPNASGEEIRSAILNAVEIHRIRRRESEIITTARAVLAILSERQREVMELVVDGITSQAIAEDLGISTRTVEKHRKSIHRCTNSTSVRELIRLHDTATRSLDVACSYLPYSGVQMSVCSDFPAAPATRELMNASSDFLR